MRAWLRAGGLGAKYLFIYLGILKNKNQKYKLCSAPKKMIFVWGKKKENHFVWEKKKILDRLFRLYST